MMLRYIPAALLPALVVAHNSNTSEELPPGEYFSSDPIDATLWIHIFVMLASFGVIFPLGMVLGLVRSKWHVPVQVAGTVLAVLGWFLGHAHKGRRFGPNVHSKFAPPLMSMLAVQVAIGVYLKLHLTRGWHAGLRRYVVCLHGVLGKAMPVVSWTQMCFGAITALGFCRADHQGQCLAHFVGPPSPAYCL